MGDDHPWPAYGFMAKIARGAAPWDATNDSLATFETITQGRMPLQHPALPAIDAATPPGCATGDRGCDTGTPNFDALAARGAVFPLAYVSHTRCVESFRSTLTGLLTTQFGTLGTPDRPDFEPKMGDFITGQAGYISYGYGKLWNKSYSAIGFDVGESIRQEAVARAAAAKAQATPPNRKFFKREMREWNYVATAGERSKKAPRDGLHSLAKFFELYYDPSIHDGDPDDESIRPPWLVWYSPRLPHAPMTKDEKYVREDKSEFAIGGAKGPRMFGNIRRLDELIGELIEVIDSYGELDNTLIVYQSDHGALLHGSKASEGENGYRTVVLASGPGIAPGQVMPQMLHGMDMLPTIRDYACEGAGCGPAPAYWLGTSFRSYLEGGASVPGRTFLFTPKVRPFRRFVRTVDGYRLTNSVKHASFKLYDVFADPDERVDLSENGLGAFDRLRAAVESQFPGPVPVN
jgi:arylsulfatase A-like enzyme